MQQILANKVKQDNVKIILDKVQDNLIRISNTDSSYSNHISQYLINRGGKRLRPLLIILTALDDCSQEKIVQVSTAAELIHTASLVHDDIVDDSKLRRGIQTINDKWNNSVAVLVGDFLFAKAFEILSAYDGQILHQFTKAISLMSVGELEQLSNRYNPKKTEEQYYKEIEGKTSTLISTCCRVGAIISGKENKDLDNLYTYGAEIGLAFQIVDDILDITGQTVDLGKPVFKDLAEGNITLPMILLLKTSPNKSTIEEIIIEKKFTDRNLEFIKEEINRQDVIRESWDIAKKHVDYALKALEDTTDFSAKSRLKSIANFILERKK